MILNTLLTNPFTEKKPTPWKPWYGYLLVIVLLVGIGRYAVDFFSGSDDGVHSRVVAERWVEQGDVLVGELPPQKNLAVPFTAHAPLGIQSAVYHRTAEEAALLMIQQYYLGAEGVIDPSLADATIQSMMIMQANREIGANLSMLALGEFATMYGGAMRATVLEDPTTEEIRATLARGVPVLVPVTTAFLGNPAYANVDSRYHVLVLRGYDGAFFIVNDSGIANGENYQYAVDVVMRAMGDWNEGNALFGEKRVLILEPEE